MMAPPTGLIFGSSQGVTQPTCTGTVVPEGLNPSALLTAETVAVFWPQILAKNSGRVALCTVTPTCGFTPKPEPAAPGAGQDAEHAETPSVKQTVVVAGAVPPISPRLAMPCARSVARVQDAAQVAEAFVGSAVMPASTRALAPAKAAESATRCASALET